MPELAVYIQEINNGITIDEENVLIEIGTSGPQGPRGSAMLSGVGAPDENLGILGDFYLNTTNMNLYGPKTESGWENFTDLVGSQELGYIHIQEVASETWTINHGLGFIPNITVIDTGKTVVEGSYNYPDSNTIVLSFVGAFSGRAYLS